jgi:hypothetical protein
MFEFRIAEIGLRIGIMLAALATAAGQDSPTPSTSPEESISPTPTASAAAPARNVPLRFVPPPMDGTISLGIWDSNDKLVRVLHFESKIDKFTVEENSLSTTWDGKNDMGQEQPGGKYRARGYLVGKLKIEDLGKAPSPPEGAADHIFVKLVTNPLASDTRAVMDIGVGFGANGVFLKTMDDLPLATISENLTPTRALISKNGEKAVDVWQEDPSGIEHLKVSNLDKIMSFDCGFFELK